MRKKAIVPILGRNITKCFEKGKFISTFDSSPSSQSRQECLSFGCTCIRMENNG